MRMTRHTLSDVWRAERAACPLHGDDPDDGLDYVAAAATADQRLAAGETQRQCPGCGFWIWDRLFIDEEAP